MPCFLGYIQKNEHSWDQYGFCCFNLVFTGSWFPIVFTAEAIYLELDTTPLILNHFLPHPTVRSREIIYLTLAIRAALLFLVSSEFARCGSFIVIWYLICCSGLRQIFRVMPDLSFNIFAKNYNNLRMIYARIVSWLNRVQYFVQLTLFWGTVLACWIVITCWYRVDLIIYLAAILVLVLFLIAQTIIFPDLVDTVIIMGSVAVWHKRKARFVHCYKRSWVTLKQVKSADSIKPIKIWYGSFFPIDKQFMVDHFRLLVERLFDIILLTQY